MSECCPLSRLCESAIFDKRTYNILFTINYLQWSNEFVFHGLNVNEFNFYVNIPNTVYIVDCKSDSKRIGRIVDEHRNLSAVHYTIAVKRYITSRNNAYTRSLRLLRLLFQIFGCRSIYANYTAKWDFRFTLLT